MTAVFFAFEDTGKWKRFVAEKKENKWRTLSKY